MALARPESAERRAPRLVERDEALATLRRYLDESASGLGGLVVIRGEAGRPTRPTAEWVTRRRPASASRQAKPAEDARRPLLTAPTRSTSSRPSTASAPTARTATGAATGARRARSSSTAVSPCIASEQRLVLGANTLRMFMQIHRSERTRSPEGRRRGQQRDEGMPTTVVSTTLEGPLDWPDATLCRGDAVDVVARLKEESDVPLRSHGSLSMNRALMAAGLVDRVQVTVFPVISGQTGTRPDLRGRGRLRPGAGREPDPRRAYPGAHLPAEPSRLTGSGSRGPRIQTSCAVVATPALVRAFAKWCFTVECDRPRLWAAAFSDPVASTAAMTASSRSVAVRRSLDRPEPVLSRQPPRRGQPLVPALDRDLVGCYRAPNTCRARHDERLQRPADLGQVTPSVSLRAPSSSALRTRAR